MQYGGKNIRIYTQYILHLMMFSLWAFLSTVSSVYCCHLMCICCILCVFVVPYMYLLHYLYITVLNLDAELLARSQCPEGPATGHLDTGFLGFPVSTSEY